MFYPGLIYCIMQSPGYDILSCLTEVIYESMQYFWKLFSYWFSPRSILLIFQLTTRLMWPFCWCPFCSIRSLIQDQSQTAIIKVKWFFVLQIVGLCHINVYIRALFLHIMSLSRSWPTIYSQQITICFILFVFLLLLLVWMETFRLNSACPFQ